MLEERAAKGPPNMLVPTSSVPSGPGVLTKAQNIGVYCEASSLNPEEETSSLLRWRVLLRLLLVTPVVLNSLQPYGL